MVTFIIRLSNHSSRINHLPATENGIAMLENRVENREAPAQLTATALEPESTVVPATVVCPYPGLPVYLDGAEKPSQAYCAVEQ
jgi:hypothetical protein